MINKAQCPSCGITHKVEVKNPAVVKISHFAHPDVINNDDGSLSYRDNERRSVYAKIKCECSCMFEHSEDE